MVVGYGQVNWHHSTVYGGDWLILFTTKCIRILKGKENKTAVHWKRKNCSRALPSFIIWLAFNEQITTPPFKSRWIIYNYNDIQKQETFSTYQQS